ncbi:MAG: hypothetical protein ACT4SY_11135 [Hyphomicrobiales bacterium]
MTLFHFSFAGGGVYFEIKSQKHVTPATGGSFICDITIPVKWPQADDARPIQVNVTIRPLIRRIATLPNQEEYVRNRTASNSPAAIPLPASGATVIVLTSLDI